MTYDRREFLKSSLVLSAAVTSMPAWGRSKSVALFPNHPFAMIQGVTTETTTQIAVDLPKSLAVRYELIKGLQTIEVAAARSHSPVYANERVDKIELTNLEVGPTYRLRVSDHNGLKIDEREFKTLDTKKVHARIGLLSCMNDGSSEDVIEDMWENLEDQDADLLLFLGDNVYGDLIGGIISGPKVLWNRYRKTRLALPFYHWKKLVPVIAIWDDHDYGKNDAVGNYKNRNDSLEQFESAYAQNEIVENGIKVFEKGAGVSSTIELFNHRFVFLDGKCWRTNDKDLNACAYFGSAQLNWLSQQISKSGQGLVVCNGASVIGKENELSMESVAPREFADFQAVLASANKPVLQASGDLHYSEISALKRAQYGIEGYHITSSCMHSVQKSKMRENAIRKEGALKNNFTILEIKGVGDYEARCIGQDGERFNSRLKI